LVSATNPESGAITYSYDASGNLSSRVAPALNQTGTATVTTTYNYDALNRLTRKSYNDGTRSAVTYGYDGAALPCTPSIGWTGGANVIGRRTSMCDASGSSMRAFDSIGRVIGETQRPVVPTGNLSNNTHYSYYLDGSLATI